MSRFCEQCGNQVPDNAVFCDSCGAPIPPLPSADQNVQPTPGAMPPSGQPQHGQPQYKQPQQGQVQYIQPQQGQPQYGQPQYGQPQYGQQPYGQTAPQQKSKVPMVLGIVFGSIAVVALLCFLGFRVVKNKAKAKAALDEVQDEHVFDDDFEAWEEETSGADDEYDDSWMDDTVTTDLPSFDDMEGISDTSAADKYVVTGPPDEDDFSSWVVFYDPGAGEELTDFDDMTGRWLVLMSDYDWDGTYIGSKYGYGDFSGSADSISFEFTPLMEQEPGVDYTTDISDQNTDKFEGVMSDGQLRLDSGYLLIETAYMTYDDERQYIIGNTSWISGETGTIYMVRP